MVKFRKRYILQSLAFLTGVFLLVSCFKREISTYAWEYKGSKKSQDTFAGTYKGKTPDRYPLTENTAPKDGETVWLTLKKNRTCIYTYGSNNEHGNWYVNYDTLFCIHDKERSEGKTEQSDTTTDYNFNHTFLFTPPNCLTPVLGKIEFCKVD